MNKYRIFIFLVLTFLLCDSLFSQDGWWKDKKYKSEAQKQKYLNCKRTFIALSEAINYSNANIIQGYSQEEIYINLLDVDRGYYKYDQIKYILESFFNTYPVNNFKWISSTKSEKQAFALGKYKYSSFGFVNTYNFSVSLKYTNNLWLIEQIIVN
jgi:hypothetical protein